MQFSLVMLLHYTHLITNQTITLIQYMCYDHEHIYVIHQGPFTTSTQSYLTFIIWTQCIWGHFKFEYEDRASCNSSCLPPCGGSVQFFILSDVRKIENGSKLLLLLMFTTRLHMNAGFFNKLNKEDSWLVPSFNVSNSWSLADILDIFIKILPTMWRLLGLHWFHDTANTAVCSLVFIF